jgi:hypothetical protein
MTNLTDKLKKGELKLGEHYYYTTIFSPTVYIQNFTRDVISFQDFKETVAEVLAEVPSYEELQAKLEENTKLKELLKECREYVAEWFADRTDVPFRQDKPRECVKKINQVLGDKTDE